MPNFLHILGFFILICADLNGLHNLKWKLLTRKWCLCIILFCFRSLAPLERCDLHPVISNIVSSFTFPGVFQPSSLQSPKIQKNYPSSLFFSWSFHHPSLWGVFPANSSRALFLQTNCIIFPKLMHFVDKSWNYWTFFINQPSRPRERRDIGFCWEEAPGDK